MTLTELIVTSRTCRRFQSSVGLTEGILADLVNMARLSPNARNAQALRYAIVTEPAARREVFGLLTLGGAFKPEQRPTVEQQPGGYIVVLGPEKLDAFGLMDVGIAAQSVNLAANASGLACCMVGAFKNPALRKLLDAPADLDPKLVLALGVPAEDRQIAPLDEHGDTAYFRDDHGVHWVPKRALEDLIVIRR